MTYDPATGKFSRAFKFVDQRNRGDDVQRSDLDFAIDEVAFGLNIALGQNLNYLGEWSPSFGAFPALRPDAKPILKNDAWVVTSSGTVNNVEFVRGDTLAAQVSNPQSAYAGSWLRVPTVTNAGIVEMVESTENSAASSQAWAESPSPPNPMDPSSKSAKTFAGEAAASAAAAAEILLNDAIVLRAFQQIDSAARRVAGSAPSLLGMMRTGVMTIYPATIAASALKRPAETPLFLTNRQIAIQRLEQLENVSFTPVATRSGENGEDQFLAATTYTGPPYSSVKTIGLAVGWDISFRSFVTAVSNPDSDFYLELATFIGLTPATAPNGFGRVPIGAVCSNALARAFGWYYAPITSLLDTHWRKFGFVQKVLPGAFSAGDLRVGDVVNSVGGGHIEFVISKTETHIEFWDQKHTGPTRTTRTIADANAYVLQRNYAQLVFDYEKLGVAFESNPYAPTSSELPTWVAPTLNPILKLNRGEGSSYLAGEEVRFNILSAGADNLVIMRNGVVVETVSLAAPEIVVRTFSSVGNYTAHCTMSGGAPNSSPVDWIVANVTAGLPVTTVAPGAEFVVTFATEGCTALAVILETASTFSISPFLPHELTAEEIAAGAATLVAPTSERDYFVRVKALTGNGSLHSSPYNQHTLTVGS